MSLKNIKHGVNGTHEKELAEGLTNPQKKKRFLLTHRKKKKKTFLLTHMKNLAQKIIIIGEK